MDTTKTVTEVVKDGYKVVTTVTRSVDVTYEKAPKLSMRERLRDTYVSEGDEWFPDETGGVDDGRMYF